MQKRTFWTQIRSLVAPDRPIAHVTSKGGVDGNAKYGGGGTAGCNAGPFHNPVHGRLDGGMGHGDTDTEVEGVVCNGGIYYVSF